MLDNIFPLVKWDAVESALQSAQSIADMNLLRTKMETLYLLSKQSHQSLATQNKIASYRLRVDRKRGEWLGEHIESGGDRRSHSRFPKVTLKSVGISKKESHILQRIASISEDVFRDHIVSRLRNGEELTTASVLRLHSAKNGNVPPLPNGTFSVIYADPFDSCDGKPSSNIQLSVSKICKLGAKVKRLSATNCSLLLWIPASQLDKFPRIFGAWGFRYCTCWVWQKEKAIPSPYGKICHELLIVGAKGRSIPTCDPKTARGVLSVQYMKKRNYYDLVERLWPDGTYLEIFSRAKRPRKGWTFWADEAKA